MSYRTTRLVEFHHTDTAGICHFSSFFLFMESVEHEFLRWLGTSVISRHDGHEISFPRIEATCRYRNPVRFEDEVEIALTVKRVGVKSIRYGFAFRCQGVDVAEGEVSVVCCRKTSDGHLRSLAIPDELAGKIRAAGGSIDAEAH